MLSWGSPPVDPNAPTRPDSRAIGDDDIAAANAPADYGDFQARRQLRQKFMVAAFLIGAALLGLGLAVASATGG